MKRYNLGDIVRHKVTGDLFLVVRGVKNPTGDFPNARLRRLRDSEELTILMAGFNRYELLRPPPLRE